MGRLNRKTLGDVKGKLGNAVFRTVNGKTFISIRPDSYNTGKSKAAKQNRKRFQAAAKFAQVVNKDPDLSACWKKAKLKGHLPYNRLIKYNIKQISGGSPSLLNIITPPDSVQLVNNISIDQENNFDISLNTNSEILKGAVSVWFFLLTGMIDPTLPEHNVFIYKLYKKELSEFTGLNNFQFILELNQFDKKRFTTVAEFLTWSAVVSKKGDKYYWSETYSDKIKI